MQTLKNSAASKKELVGALLCFKMALKVCSEEATMRGKRHTPEHIEYGRDEAEESILMGRTQMYAGDSKLEKLFITHSGCVLQKFPEKGVRIADEHVPE